MAIGQFMPLFRAASGFQRYPFEDYVIMSLRMEDSGDGFTLVDDTIINNKITSYGHTLISSAQKKFGKSSVYFDGSGDYAVATKHLSFNQANDFTLEFWFRLDVVRESTLICHKSSTDAWPPLVWITNSGQLILHVVGNSNKIVSQAGAVKANQWHHLSYGRVGKVWNIYLDGQLIGTWLHNSNDMHWSDWIFRLASQANGAASFSKGYFDELRWWKGVSVRNGVTNFTPPKKPWAKIKPKSSGTVTFNTGTVTFKKPPFANTMKIKIWGGGGGGSNGQSVGGAGGAATIPALSLSAGGGNGGGTTNGSAGGTATGGDINLSGKAGARGSGPNPNGSTYGGAGGSGCNSDGVNNGSAGTTSTRRFGSGSDGDTSYYGGGGGGGGAFLQKTLTPAQMPEEILINIGTGCRVDLEWN